jgi:signal transduction histidine kinase
MKKEQTLPRVSNRFDTSFLSELQDFQSVIFDTNGKQITKPSGFNKFCELIQKAKDEGKLSSDPTKTIDEIHTRSCSFFSDIAEAVIPIKYEDETISTWAVSKNSFDCITREELDIVSKKIGVDPDDLWGELQNIPVTTQEEFDRSVYFLHTTISTMMRMREQDTDLKENLDKFEEITKLVAHDMRENLHIILGFIDLLDGRYQIGDDVDDGFKEFVFYISECGEKLKTMAELLIDMCGEDN